MAHKLKIFCENPSDGELSNELKSKYQPNEYLLANETNAVLRGATIGTKLIYDVIDCADITLGYDTAPSEFSAQIAAITKGLLAVTNGDMATNEKLGTIKVGYQADSSAENRNYPLKVDANGNAYTNVPWSTDTSGTPNNTPNALVKRDSNGNFSANTITANLAGNASTANLADNASTADRINTKKSIGSISNPVYVDSNGEVKACSSSFSDYYDLNTSHIECSYNGTTITISSSEVEKLSRLEDQILFLKLNYTNSSNTKYDILKFNDRIQDSGYLTYTFANITNTVEISLTGERYDTLDEILMYGTTTSKATYADYAEYSIKNSNGSYSKFTHKQNGVLYVGDTHIVSKKRLLWSGSVNIGEGVGDNIPIYTSTTDLKGKSLEIWLKDKGTLDGNNTPNSPYSIKIKVLDIDEWSYLYDIEKLDMYNSKFTGSKTLAFQHISLLYNPIAFKIFGRCYMSFYNLNTFAHNTGVCDCYVTAIYEIIE